MKILSVDTSAQVAGAAVYDGEKLLADFNVNAGLTHSQTLMPLCEAALSSAGLTVGEIDAFAVSAGPGSFTGIRIGVSAIKGLAAASGKPCIPVSTLEGMAYNFPAEEGILCCVMDARCKQVYNALFRWENGTLRRLCDDRALSIKDLGEDLLKFDEKIFLIGDGADLCYNELKGVLPLLRQVPPHLRLQRAASVALAAWPRAEEGKTCSAAELMPIYLRLPQAERELLQKQKK